MPITHPFTSAKSDGADATLVRPSNWNAAHTIDTLDVPQTFALSGDITPTSLAADQNNYSPAGLATATIIRQDVTANRTITGLATGADGRIVILENISASFTITLTNEDSASTTAANRFLVPNAASVVITPQSGVMLVYDAASSRWRTAATTSSLSASTPAAIGTAAVGTAVTGAHGDHVHATGAGTPATQAFGDVAATGSGPAAAMTDHKHAMPADPVTAHAAAGDPHPAYATDTDLTNHAAAADPHTGYVLESVFAAKGDILIATANDTPGILTAGADDTILMADAAAGGGLKWVASATPSTQAFGDAAAIGTADSFTRGDHKHAMPADPVTAHAAAGDPHTGYRLESADHTHASTGIQAGQVAHSALTGLTNDEHTQYQKESEKAVANGYPSLGADALVPQDQLGTGVQDGTKFLRDDGTWQPSAAGGIQPTIVDVKGDIIVASAADTVVRKAAGADDTILMADAAQADGLKWVASAAPAAETFGAAQALGTTDTFSRGDHVHGMPADPVTAHAAAGDPHTVYRLESADHTHASTGLQAGTIAHSALTGLTNDEHSQYVLEATAGITGTLALTADISPTDVGTINDWAPTGIGTSSVIRWNGASGMTLSGITTGADGRVLVLMNATSGQSLTLRHDLTSTAANRFYLPGGVDNYWIPSRSAVLLMYDATLSRWQIAAATPHLLADTNPSAIGTAAPGTGLSVSRADHVHAFTPISIDFSKGGTLATGVGAFRWYNRSGRTLTFDSVSASVGTAPTGASIIVDVNKGGTTIYTTQANRPTIPVSTNFHDDTTAPNITTISDNEYLTIDIDQIGSTVAGADLTVQVWLRG